MDTPSLPEIFSNDSLIPLEHVPSSTPTSDPAHDLFYPPFTLDELKSALCDVRPKSSPDLDKFIFEVILHLSEPSLNLLLQILNAIFDGQLFPDSWKNFLIFLLPKTTRRKFRPISLACCFLKILERLTLSRLNHWVENNNILYPFSVRL